MFGLKTSVIIQVIGFIAVGVSLFVFQVNQRRSMLKLMILSALLYATHFYLLGAYTGAAMNLVSASRNYVFNRSKLRTKWIPAIFIAFFTLAAAATWQGPLSLLPLGGMISGTIAFWQTNPKYIRRFALISPPLWFTYNLVSNSYPGMLVEMGMLISNLVGTGRFDIHHAKPATKSNILG